jgi:hypothetical protein
MSEGPLAALFGGGGGRAPVKPPAPAKAVVRKK